MKTYTRLLSALVAGALAAGSASAKVTDLGNPYRPGGATYTITAKQDINSTNGLGGTSAGAQVNQDFEFQGTLGVAYTAADSGGKKGGGGLTEFGIGIYSSGGVTLSTGLEIRLDQLSSANTVTATLADFDLSSTSTFFNPQKVESSVLVYGAGGTIIFSANPTQVFNALVNTTGPSGSGEDYWNLNFGTLLSQNGQAASTLISGFLLYADSTNGEKVPSDPYFITSINAGIPAIPEPSTYIGSLALIGLLVGMHTRAVVQKAKNQST